MRVVICAACVVWMGLSAQAAPDAETDTQNKIFRIADCEAPITTVFANYLQSETGAFDFRSGQISFSHRRAIQSSASDQEVRQYNTASAGELDGQDDKKASPKCRTSNWEYAFEGFLTFSDSDFSEAIGGNLGVGLTRFFRENKTAFSLFVRGG